MKHVLLTRPRFHNAVMLRDGGTCVLCKGAATEAHHILDRRLFADGGYYADNGASVCEPCHLRCESTEVSVEEVRKAAGIKYAVLPPGIEGQVDKWGNPILPNGRRMKGPLFNDAGTQRSLERGGALGLFTEWVKAPRTPHLPWSPGRTNDDCAITNLDVFTGSDVVVTVKLDGENTSLYRDGLHARSLNTVGGPERDRVKALHAQVAHDIPQGWRVTGENVFAKHSIAYSNLESFFYVFGVWNEKNVCLSWAETIEWCTLLGLVTAPVLYRGEWDEERVERLYTPTFQGDECEGYVVRTAGSFHYDRFGLHVAKYVRAGHVQTNEHWKHSVIVPNKLRAS